MTLETPRCSTENSTVTRLKSKLDAVIAFAEKKWQTQNLSDKNKQAYLRLEIEAVRCYGSLVNLDIVERVEKLEQVILEQNFR